MTHDVLTARSTGPAPASQDVKRNDIVTYKTFGGLTIEAIVRRRYRDGTAAVEARFRLRPDGSRAPGYLNFKSRIAVSDLSPIPHAAAGAEGDVTKDKSNVE